MACPGQLHGAIGSKQRGHRGGVTVVDAPDIFRTQSGQRVAFFRGYVFKVEADLVHSWRPFRLEAAGPGFQVAETGDRFRRARQSRYPLLYITRNICAICN
jgi:hypothetical protein